jgi:hypothetical protein
VAGLTSIIEPPPVQRLERTDQLAPHASASILGGYWPRPPCPRVSCPPIRPRASTSSLRCGRSRCVVPSSSRKLRPAVERPESHDVGKETPISSIVEFVAAIDLTLDRGPPVIPCCLAHARRSFLCDQSPDPGRRTRHHIAGRTPPPFGAARGEGSPQARGHRTAALACRDVLFDLSAAGGRQIAVEISRQFQQ